MFLNKSKKVYYQLLIQVPSDLIIGNKPQYLLRAKVYTLIVLDL
jgi:hypothetical protein